MPRNKKSVERDVLDDIALEDVGGMSPKSKKRLFGKPTQKRLVMFDAKKGMGMGKRSGNAVANAKSDAQRWSDAAPAMARENAKNPMVVEQTPRGNIMGRATSARTTGSKGSQMGKADGMGVRKGRGVPHIPSPGARAIRNAGGKVPMSSQGSGRGMMKAQGAVVGGKRLKSR